MIHFRNGLLFIFLFTSAICYSQLPERQLQIGAGTLMNSREYSDMYLDPIVYKASLVWGKRHEKKVTSWYGAAVGYYKLKPAADTLYYDTDSYLVLTDRTVLQLGAKMKWDWPIQKSILFSLGTDIGVILESYSYVDIYPGVVSHVEFNGTGIHVAPFGGFEFYLSDALGLGLFAQYEMSAQGEDVGGVFRRALLLGGKLSIIF